MSTRTRTFQKGLRPMTRVRRCAAMLLLATPLLPMGAQAAPGDILVADRDAFGGPCLNGCGGVIRVNPVGGAQTTVSSGGSFVEPDGIAVEPPPAATPAPVDAIAPLITGLSAKPKVFAVDPKGPSEPQAAAKKRQRRAKKGTTLTYTLSEAARVVFTIERKTRGRKVGKRCRKKTRRNRSRRPCSRYLKAGSFAHQSAAGLNRKKFSGRIGKRRLRPASYRTTLVATDPAGNRSSPARLSFRVVRR
jgi:hypothetical protein